jgi:hypothetical protein
MPRWEVMLFRKKGERLGVVDARDEKEATAKAAETFNIPSARQTTQAWRVFFGAKSDFVASSKGHPTSCTEPEHPRTSI